MTKAPPVRVVIDTNVLVPSLYADTPIFRRIISRDLTVIWNVQIRDEAHRIIERMLEEHYYPKYGMQDAADIHRMFDLVLSPEDEVFDMPDFWPAHSRDRKDDPFLWAAIQGNAEFVISYDRRHMLVLRNIQGIPIGRPAEFFSWAKVARPRCNL